jgi:hypothetical protein
MEQEGMDLLLFWKWIWSIVFLSLEMSFTLYHIVFRLNGYETTPESIAYMFLDESSARKKFDELKKCKYDGLLQETLLYKVTVGQYGHVYKIKVIDSKLITQEDIDWNS